jgi:hypothetical protein
VLAEVGAALNVRARREADHGAGVAGFVFPEVVLAPVAQDDERGGEALSILLRLRFCRVRINREPLRFDYRQRMGSLILEEVVRTSVCRSFLGRDLRLVFDVPPCLSEKAIHHHAGVGFGGHDLRHHVRPWSSFSR